MEETSLLLSLLNGQVGPGFIVCVVSTRYAVYHGMAVVWTADPDGISYYVVCAYAQTTGGELIVDHASGAHCHWLVLA